MKQQLVDEQAIWDPVTGITDLEIDPSVLSTVLIREVQAQWDELRTRLNASGQLSAFVQMQNREWAIETGVIENLYNIDRVATQILIEKGIHAEHLGGGSTNKPQDYVLRLLQDQESTIESAYDFVEHGRHLSVSLIKELHAQLVRSQGKPETIDSQGRRIEVDLIKGDWKKQPNFPVRDGVTFTYCPPEQVDSEMDRLVEFHQAHEKQDVPIDVQAAWLHHRFAQIHPFQDGNGRVARAMASLVLIEGGLLPLVVSRDDKTAYLDALEFADNRNLGPLVELIASLQAAQIDKARMMLAES